ncbi:hypothetical protein LX36DRAFT_656868 [Colletotrichum falcatum]|nr:hypothetical protein LX36DRAFT_656868 [Colletotrichum falcatum]
MSPRPRRRITPTPAALIVSCLAAQCQAVFVNDFSAYPVGARSCMDAAAAASGCTGNTVTEMNTCLCGNGGDFIMATARCVEKQAKEQLGAVYAMLLTSCTDSRTPLGISQAQFLEPEDDLDDTPTTLATSITKPPAAASSTRAAETTTPTSLTTYRSVAPGGVTVTITRAIEVAPTGTGSGGQGSSSNNNNNNNNNNNEKSESEDSHSRPAIAAGITGALAFLMAGLAFLCYRRRKQRRERNGQDGSGGKFAALSSATSLTTMTASSNPGQPTAAYTGADGPRPDTTHTMPAAWGQQQQQQQQQYGPESPRHWQTNSSNQYGQHTGNWPSPLTNTDGTMGTWALSPSSTYPPPNSSRGLDSPTAQNASWNPPHGLPAGVPAPHPSYPSANGYAPVFELPGDETRAVEADSTPIGTARPAHSPSRSIQSTPVHMSAQPTAPAPTHHLMSRQIDDALQISRVELPPPRYSGPSSGPEWAGDEKR